MAVRLGQAAPTIHTPEPDMTTPQPDRKVILITGAGSDAAQAARRLAGQGHHVVLGARATRRLAAQVADIRAEGGSAEYFALDPAGLNDMDEFVAFALDVHGRVDLIVDEGGEKNGAPPCKVTRHAVCYVDSVVLL